MLGIKHVLLVGSLTVVAGGCSFLVSFDETERPCGPDSNDADALGDCLDGYSCMVNVCVENNSVREGITCSVNNHCEVGHVCTTAPFVCRESCGQLAYGNNSACSSARGCVRKVDPDNTAVGACVPTECTTPADCPDPDGIATATCVAVTDNVSVCEQACAVNCGGATCTGNCGFDDDRNPLACQPLGRDQQLACIPEGLRQHGDACNFVSSPCTGSSACIMAPDGSYGVCLDYCDPANVDPLAACGGVDDPSNPGTAATCNVIAGKGFAICGSLPAAPIGGDDGPPGGDSPVGGDPGPPVGKYCQEFCTGLSDCLADYDCQGNRCVYSGSPFCADNPECVILYSGWFFTCTVDGDCSMFGLDYCIDYNGGGYCAYASPARDCAANSELPETMLKLEDASPVEVCADLSAVCDGYCKDICAADSECGAEQPHCDTTSGVCECQSSAECASGSKTVCSNGQCICGTGDECTGSYSGDLCTAQPDCGCDNDLDCNGTASHPSTTWVCE